MAFDRRPTQALDNSTLAVLFFYYSDKLMPIFIAGRGHKLRVFRPANRAGEDTRLAEARNNAMNMRREGLTYRQIAAAMGISAHVAYNHVQHELRIIRDQTAEDTEAIRDLELQRLDEMQRHLGPGIRSGEAATIALGIKISERRSKLLGLDAPERKEILHAVISPEEAAKLSEEDLLGRVRKLTSMVAASLPPGNPALALLDGETVDDNDDPDLTDAALEAEDARPPAKVSIDVRGHMSLPRQGRMSRVVNPFEFVDDDDNEDCDLEADDPE